MSPADGLVRALPVWACQRCRHVQVEQFRDGAGSVVTRWTCGEGLHMEAACTARVATPYNLPKETVCN